MWICSVCNKNLETHAAIEQHKEQSLQCWKECEEKDLGNGWVTPDSSPIAAQNINDLSGRRGESQ